MSTMSYLKSMNKDIDDRTKISLFAVICTLPFMVCAVAWLTSVDAKATQARDEIVGLRALSIDIRERQIRMEQMVKDLTDNKE